MSKHKNKEEKPRYVKRRLSSALCMLLVSAILLAATSYAWLVLSAAPEVTGITTNIGANGSLEIALLDTETRTDLSLIRTAIGDSLANDHAAEANTTWGNLIDLTAADYGLGEITLLPARLQYAQQSGGGYRVNSGLLSVPTYGYDGRIVDLTDNTVSAVYSDKEFSYNVGVQDYGVRAIGTSDTLSVQASALAMAKSNITTYTKSAGSTAAATLNSNGADLVSILVNYSVGMLVTFDTTQLDTIESMIEDLNTSLDYIDQALRQGLVAMAASKLGDEDTFVTVRNRIMDTAKGLPEIVADLSELGADALPEEYTNWIASLQTMQNSLNLAQNKCAALRNSGTSYTWEQLKEPLSCIMDVDQVYINETLFPELDKDAAAGLVGSDITLTLAPGSGVFADIADFTDDYSAMITVMGTNVEIVTRTLQDTPYLLALAAGVKDLEAADGSGDAVQVAELTTTYGYALDMAFRCNAAVSDLLLQTAAVQRVYSDSSSASTMGGGSYMEFSTGNTDLTLEKIIQLMDAVRVAFIDDQGTLLKVAKLNTSNRSVVDGVVKAPLYLYDYSFSEEDGAMIMGERQKTDNVITSLEQNVAKAVSVVVWLDGDIVDNTMVSATQSASLSGVLNLQFASSATLIPADNNALLSITADKNDLNTAVLAAETLYQAGQGTYTTVTWNAFADAYSYAEAINENANATEAQIYCAAANLATTHAALAEVSDAELQAKISELRAFAGETDTLARVVVEDAKTGEYLALNPYTAEQYGAKKGEIMQVDYNNNLHDEGNDVYTPIYTDESWSALASALYSAEALDMNPKATNAQIDAAISAMQTAYDNLQRMVFYMPYDYNGTLYYYAISDVSDDTYGKWYDADFKRVVSDLMILNLDADAELTDIAVIEQSDYIPYNSDVITPYVSIQSIYYPSLANEQIVALQWKVSNSFIKAMTESQKSSLTALMVEAEALNSDSDADMQVDTDLLAEVEELLDEDAKPTEEAAEDLISRLQAAVTAATPEPEATGYITADQVILLSTAIDSAKSIYGYDSEEALEDADAQAMMVALRTAVEDAQACVENADTKTEDAAAALDALNARLTGYGKTAITVENTLPIYVPDSTDWSDIVYAVENAGAVFYNNHESTSAYITAVGLTRNGVLIVVEKEVQVYYPAKDVDFVGEQYTLEEGQTMTVEAVLTRHKLPGGQNEQGVYVDEDGIPVPDAVVETQETADGEVLFVYLPCGETIKSCVWASENMDVISVSGEKSSSCTVTAVSAGEANLTVSVVTVQGNVFDLSMRVTVTDAS